MGFHALALNLSELEDDVIKQKTRTVIAVRAWMD